MALEGDMFLKLNELLREVAALRREVGELRAEVRQTRDAATAGRPWLDQRAKDDMDDWSSISTG